VVAGISLVGRDLDGARDGQRRFSIDLDDALVAPPVGAEGRPALPRDVLEPNALFGRQLQMLARTASALLDGASQDRVDAVLRDDEATLKRGVAGHEGSVTLEQLSELGPDPVSFLPGFLVGLGCRCDDAEEKSRLFVERKNTAVQNLEASGESLELSSQMSATSGGREAVDVFDERERGLRRASTLLHLADELDVPASDAIEGLGPPAGETREETHDDEEEARAAHRDSETTTGPRWWSTTGCEESDELVEKPFPAVLGSVEVYEMRTLGDDDDPDFAGGRQVTPQRLSIGGSPSSSRRKDASFLVLHRFREEDSTGETI
jgi:hypothetical protein